jgi:hypothetical protein
MICVNVEARESFNLKIEFSTVALKESTLWNIFYPFIDFVFVQKKDKPGNLAYNFQDLIIFS